MSPRRRALLLLALATLLGTLAAGSVGRREAALQRALGPRVPVLVTRAPVPAGAPLASARPVLRMLPRRFAPPDPVAGADALEGARAAVALPAGSYVTEAALRAAPLATQAPIGAGERVAEVVAQGDPAAVVPGARVDVVVTREASGDQPGGTTLALEDVEVLAARAVQAPSGQDASDGAHVLASLRVSVRQAVYLAAAQSFARELRLLARAPGDHARQRAGLAVDERLR
jgi:pilus assembly protein CpaB